MANSAVAADYGGSVGYRSMLLDAFSYIGMFLLWLNYILKRDPDPSPSSPKTGLDDLDAWKKALDGVTR